MGDWPNGSEDPGSPPLITTESVFRNTSRADAQERGGQPLLEKG